MSQEQPFRQPPADLRPTPTPSEPVRFTGDAYPLPNGRKSVVRVLYKPVGQKALIAAKQARRKKAGSPSTSSVPEETPSTWTYATEMERDASAPPANAYCDNSQPTSEAIEDALKVSAPSNARTYCGDSQPPRPMTPANDTEETAIEVEVSVIRERKHVPPGLRTNLDEEYARNRAEDLAQLMTPASITPTDVDAQFRSRSQPSSEKLTGPTLTPDQLNALTARARKKQMTSRGVFKTGGNIAKADKPKGKGGADDAKPQGRAVLGTSQRHVKIPSGQDKHRTDRRQAIATRRENKRPLVPLEVTDALLESVAKSALERFKTNRVLDAKRVFISLVEVLSPADGRGQSGLIAHMMRCARTASQQTSADEPIVDKRFLHSAATKALGELIKAAWQMMGPDASQDVTDDPDARRRVGATRRRTALTTESFRIRRHVMRNKRVVFFILLVEKSGRQTLQGVVC